MATSYDPSYFGREQSLIKHRILEKYLERFAVIIGSWCDGIIYVDGFSGPWNVQSSKLDDASFSDGAALDLSAHARRRRLTGSLRGATLGPARRAKAVKRRGLRGHHAPGGACGSLTSRGH